MPHTLNKANQPIKTSKQP